VTVDRLLRLIAGTVVFISVALAHFFHPAWLFLTLFVSLNLIQSSFTNWCPAMTLLRKAGVPDVACEAGRKR